MNSSLSPEIKEIITASMKLIKHERAKTVDIFLGRFNNISDSEVTKTIYPDFDEETIVSKSPADLERDALAYYEKNDIKILNQYGFFETKKKRQASTIWASCIVCIILSIIVGAIIIQNLGIEHFSFGGCIIYMFAIVFSLYPGMTVGPAILGLNDKNHLKDLEENIKKQFIRDYIKEHSK